MAEEKRKVAIDADFFLKLTEKENDGSLFVKIIDEMNVFPVMHQYVYEEELYGNATARNLIKDDVIQIIEGSSFLVDIEKSNYEAAFRSAYYYFNRTAFEGDVYQYKTKGKSLGEIRTILMAVYMGIDLFLSDDGAAKAFVTSRINSKRHPLAVYDIYDALLCVGNKKDRKISWREVKGCAKAVFQNRKNLYDKLRDAWHEINTNT